MAKFKLINGKGLKSLKEGEVYSGNVVGKYLLITNPNNSKGPKLKLSLKRFSKA